LRQLIKLHAPHAGFLQLKHHLVQIDDCHSSEGGERQHVVVLAATNFPCHT
jgi:hypothetical protein